MTSSMAASQMARRRRRRPVSLGEPSAELHFAIPMMARTGSALVWVGAMLLLYASPSPAIAAQYSSFDDELTSMPDVLVRRRRRLHGAPPCLHIHIQRADCLSHDSPCPAFRRSRLACYQYPAACRRLRATALSRETQ